MTDPTRKRQLEELDEVTLCTRILCQARNELYVNMRFLDVALSSLGFEADWGRQGLATDGAVIYYGPEHLLRLYKKGRVLVNRAYLHILFHCLFCHLYTRKGRDKEYWDLACDIAMESVIDGLYQKCIHVPRSALRRETYLRIRRMLAEGEGGRDVEAAQKNGGRVGAPPVLALTAERVYRALVDMKPAEKRLRQLQAEFMVDSHDLWEQEEDPRQAMRRQNQWNDNREKMQTSMETGSKEESEEEGSLLDSLQVENRERYDYSQFLRKFAVIKEELQVDVDSFDYGFYTYGLSLYGNMPLIEPLESKEVCRIEEFAIVVDTSMSCSGELIQRFLEETYDVLSESESYFKKIHVRIIQCDDKVQSDVVITCAEELAAYMESFEIRGYGGTDFRPAFEYVNGLLKTREISRLKGLIYFTDGKGIYPVQAPPYDTAFVFIERMFSDEAVPAWAMKVVLEEEQLREYHSVLSSSQRTGSSTSGKQQENRE
ncbi:vWA domain-containing protein [Lacrimispora sp. 210928-DFI.3.58]|uniref:vWA domain-containing protein n=1 Tax=Lacrimispora sp. 210928-DFI.3.58 TaxID=2883214 RepID=UPI0015B54728|nr:VWA-like domain-containing protein [Lacrimispora sp. 210928-DFI.3.58]MCB7318878.1 VWA-like domain-containing protein [Lacrimispora sp. 210928-DFI.3.58]